MPRPHGSTFAQTQGFYTSLFLCLPHSSLCLGPWPFPGSEDKSSHDRLSLAVRAVPAHTWDLPTEWAQCPSYLSKFPLRPIFRQEEKNNHQVGHIKGRVGNTATWQVTPSGEPQVTGVLQTSL